MTSVEIIAFAGRPIRFALSTWPRRLLVGLVFAVACGAVTWTAHVWLLRSAADLWIVSDPIGPADAVAVFGGGLEDRPFAAAAYYRRGLVPKVLISNVHEGPAVKLGVVQSDTALTRAVLRRLEVPETAIQTFGGDNRNTHQEVLALLDWAKQAGAHTIIVPTEIFSARRVRWMLRQAFPEKIKVLVPAIDPPDYRADDWWRDEQGLISFQNEVVKYLYYRVRY